MKIEGFYIQLKNIYSALFPDGVYICLTPNRLSGRHDISRYFDEVANRVASTKVHLDGFKSNSSNPPVSKIIAIIGARGYYVSGPVMLIRVAERVLAWLNRSIDKNVARCALFRIFLGIRLVGRK